MITLWLKNLFGWVTLNPLKALLYLLALLGLVYVLTWFACGSKTYVPTEAEKVAAAEAIKTGNEQKLKEVLVKAEVKEAEINANVANAQANTWAAQKNAKEKYDAMTRDELQAEACKKFGGC